MTRRAAAAGTSGRPATARAAEAHSAPMVMPSWIVTTVSPLVASLFSRPARRMADRL